MLIKRARSSKRKKWNQEKLAFKKKHYLTEEKDNDMTFDFNNVLFEDESSDSDYSISSDDSSDEE